MIIRQNDSRINELEAEMLEKLPIADCPVTHKFSDGLYIREIFMPAESLVTSQIHKTQHPFIISKGSVSVSIDGGEWEYFEAPYTGITQPGTRRVLYIHEDCVWTTIHKNEDNKQDIDAIWDRLIQPYTNELINTKNIHMPNEAIDPTLYGFNLLNRTNPSETDVWEEYRIPLRQIMPERKDAIKLDVYNNNYTLSIITNEVEELKIASRYTCNTVKEFEFLLFNGRIGAYFNHPNNPYSANILNDTKNIEP